MLVWRVERPNGEGPYSFMSWRKGDHTTLKRTPPPDIDGLGSHKFDHFFGFKTKEDLHKWFTKTELKKLKEIGFIIRIVRAKKVYISRSGKQLAFKPVSKRYEKWRCL